MKKTFRNIIRKPKRNQSREKESTAVKHQLILIKIHINYLEISAFLYKHPLVSD